jgi:hypothetical protein
VILEVFKRWVAAEVDSPALFDARWPPTGGFTHHVILWIKVNDLVLDSAFHP